MNRHLLINLIALTIAGFFHTTEAATLNLQFPNNANIYTVGKDSFFDAKIYVNSVNDLAGFDFDLTYNHTNLSAQSLTSASIFGADTFSIANTITPGVGAALGRINFAESTLAFTGLDITTPTLLGTVTFKALNISPSNTVNITANSRYIIPQLLFLSDSSGPATTVQGGTVIITAAAPATIPLPASAFLFASGLLAVFGIRKNKVRKLEA